MNWKFQYATIIVNLFVLAHDHYQFFSDNLLIVMLKMSKIKGSVIPG